MKYWDIRGEAEVWPCSISRGYMTDWEYQQGRFLADYAKAGKWAKVLAILSSDDRLVNVNQAWPYGSAALHRAAEQGAGEDVVAGLLERGALRSLRDSSGRTAHEIAVAAGCSSSVAALLVPPASPFSGAELAALDAHIADVIGGYVAPIFGSDNVRKVLRFPPAEVLHEPPGQELWMQVPMMMGGFRLRCSDRRIDIVGGYRRPDESGEMHVTAHGFLVTPEGWQVVHESRT